MKIKQFTVVKLPLKKILEQDCRVTLTDKEQEEYLVEQADSLLFDQILRLRGKYSPHISELILMVAKKNPKQEKQLRTVLDHGFIYNGRRYMRFGKSASQGKAGITAFVSDDIFDELYRITQMDIPVEECVISKYEAQRCLLFSSCTIIKDYIPNIIIIGEYEKVLKDRYVRYVVQKQKEITDKETGKPKTISVREVEEGYKDIKLSPFDGCGCHEAEFAQKTSQVLGLDYTAIGNQIRLPFIKGYSVYVPFRAILHEMGISELRDIYGTSHPVDTIDCIWNISMFKGHGMFFEQYGPEAWNMYMKTLKKYQFKLGISKYSHHMKDINPMARLNFQYLQCLDLWNEKYIESFGNRDKKYDILAPENEGKIIQTARYTTGLFEKIIKGDKFYTYKFMGIRDTEDYEPSSTYLKAVLINNAMLKDPAVKQFIYGKLKKYITQSKLGKIYADGFYHTVVGDMMGYLEFAAGLEPKGCLDAKEFFAETMPEGKVLSFRSPLVDPSEVNDVRLVSNPITKKWFRYFKNQDLVMINMYDLSAPQQGGMDQDGDAVYLCRNSVLADSKIQKPIIIDIDDKATVQPKPYTREHITEYELMTRDSRIGEITNAATSIENKYTTNPEIRKTYENLTSLLRIFQGKEIDYLKTGLRWQMNSGLRNHLKQLPWFLLYNYPGKLQTYEKIKKKNQESDSSAGQLTANGFRSPSPMNELCDYINTWEKKHLLWDTSVADTGPLLVNPSLPLDNKKIRRQIRHMINEFGVAFKELIKRKQQESSEEDYNEINLLIETYRQKLLQTVDIHSEEELANYVIHISYSNHSICKYLAWFGYGDYLLENLKKNSPSKNRWSIREIPEPTDNSYEYLGKYYLFEEAEPNV